MPLIQSSSRKAFQKNTETEMKANPSPEDRKQNLAIAYSIKRKNQRKKMASGGTVDQSAASERRPMPDNTYDDSDNAKMNSRRKPNGDDGWTQNRLDADGNFSKKPGQVENHNWQNEGMTDENDARTDADMNMTEGKKLQSKQELMDSMSSPEKFADENDASDERGESMLRQSAPMSSEGNESLRQSRMAAGGRMVQRESMAPDEEYDSVADAIIAKKRHEKMMADGGMVDLNANSEESPNMEDQYSFEANGKEQYDDDQISGQPEDSNEMGDEREMDAENKMDMVDAIRKKMKQRYGA